VPYNMDWVSLNVSGIEKLMERVYRHPHTSSFTLKFPPPPLQVNDDVNASFLSDNDGVAASICHGVEDTPCLITWTGCR
jgi:hypothetical protein